MTGEAGDITVERASVREWLDAIRAIEIRVSHKRGLVISCHKGRSVDAAMAYFETHLQVGDYYSQEDRTPGRWSGNLAKRLGIDDREITRDSLLVALKGQFSLLGAEGDRMRRSEIKFIDFTYSPCKSVMILAALNPQIARDLENIVAEEFARIEKQLAGCRDQRGGEVREKITGELLIGRFKHDTNRLGEPGIHFHNLIMNSTYDVERGLFVALDARKLFQARREFDGEVQARVAQYFLSKGFTTVTGKSGVFEVAEVPSGAIDLFSTRAKAVQARIAELKRELPRLPDWALRERAVLDTRPKKVVCSTEELRRETKRRLDEAGLTIRYPLREFAPMLLRDELMVLGRKALESAESSVFMTESVCTRRKLAMETLKYGRGVIGKHIVEAVIAECPRYETFRDKDNSDWIINRAAQKIEHELMTVAKRLLSQGKPISSNVSVPDELSLDPVKIEEALSEARSRGETLSLEALLQSRQQFRAAYEYAMGAASDLIFIEGAAGTGKSFFLKILARDIRDQGREVYAFAPTGTASRVNLRADFEEAQTVSHLLLNERLQEKVKGQVLVIDEAPLLDGDSLVKLLKLAQRLECKVILQGDLAQQHAVGAVDGVRLLRQELGLGLEMERLSVNRRQLHEADKEIALAWSQKRVSDALAKMKEAGVLIEGKETRTRGGLLESKEDHCVGRLAHEYTQALANGDRVLVVSSTHRQGDLIAEFIRRCRREAGQIGENDYQVLSQRALDDGATLSDGTQFFQDAPDCYRVGMTLKVRNQAGHSDLKGGGKLRVISIDKGVLKLADVQGRFARSIDVSKEQMSHYQVYELRALPVAIGDLVRLQEKVVVESVKGRYHKKQIFERGSVQKVVERLADGTLVFESGLKLAETDGRIAQGYVSTSIPAQGMTADRVWAYESIFSAQALATCQAMYMVATRHRQEFKLFTEDAVALERAASRLGNRLSALELKRGDDFKYEAPPVPFTEQPHVSPQQSTEDIIARKRTILAQIELKASRQTTVPIPVIPPTPHSERKADIPAPKLRMSVLDQIELEPPKIKSKNKLKQKDKTLEF